MKIVIGLLVASLCCLDARAGKTSVLFENGVVDAPGFHFEISQTVFAPILLGSVVVQQSNSDGSMPSAVASNQTEVTLRSFETTGSVDTAAVNSTILDSPPVLTVSAVPETSTWAMIILGFVGVALVKYRLRKMLALPAVNLIAD